MNISLNLTVDQVNIILNALLARPYGEGAALMTSIREQGEAQVKPSKEVQETNAE